MEKRKNKTKRKMRTKSGQQFNFDPKNKTLDKYKVRCLICGKELTEEEAKIPRNLCDECRKQT